MCGRRSSAYASAPLGSHGLRLRVCLLLSFPAGLWGLRGTATVQLCLRVAPKSSRESGILKSMVPVAPHLNKTYPDFSVKVSLG